MEGYQSFCNFFKNATTGLKLFFSYVFQNLFLNHKVDYSHFSIPICDSLQILYILGAGPLFESFEQIFFFLNKYSYRLTMFDPDYFLNRDDGVHSRRFVIICVIIILLLFYMRSLPPLCRVYHGIFGMEV